MKDLPLVGRNFFNLVVLTPGVTGRAAGGGQAYAQSNADIFINEYGVNMNANGARTESNNFLVDSSTVSSSQRSGVVNITPNPESRRGSPRRRQQLLRRDTAATARCS